MLLQALQSHCEGPRRRHLPSLMAEETDIPRGEVTHAWSAVEPEIESGFSDFLYYLVNVPSFLCLKILFNSDFERTVGQWEWERKHGLSSPCLHVRAGACTPRFCLPLAWGVKSCFKHLCRCGLTAANLIPFCFVQMLKGMDLHLNQYLV